MPQLPINLTNINLIKTLHEASVLLLLLASLLLLLALFSFNPADSGWNGVTLQVTNNLTGVAGSWLADFLFSLMGVAAWLLVLVLAYLAIQLFYQPWQEVNWSPFTPSVRCLGFILLIVGLSAVASGHSFAPHLPYGAGGILGESFATLVKPLLGYWGTGLFFVGSFFVGLSLVTGWSWLAVMDEVGHFLIQQAQILMGLDEYETEEKGANNTFKSWPSLINRSKLSDFETRRFEGTRFKAPRFENRHFESQRFETPLVETPLVETPSVKTPKKASNLTDDPLQCLVIKPIRPAMNFAINDKKATQDKLYAAALDFVLDSRRASVFALQRHFELDYDSAVCLIERMERAGFISSLQADGQRRLLTTSSSTNEY